MKRVRKRAPLGRSTSAQISTVLSPPFFLSSCQMRSEGANVPHFTHLRRIFTHKQPEDTQGTGDAGHTLRISEKKDLKNKKECTT